MREKNVANIGNWTAFFIMTYLKTSDSQIRHWNILTIRYDYFFNQIVSIQGY